MRIVNRLVSCVILLFIITSCSSKYVFYTEDIHRYRNEEYPIHSKLFPEQIPNNSTVKSYSNYFYYHEVYDAYLELVFNSKEEMDMYLFELTQSYLQSKTEEGLTKPQGGWILKEQNPHNTSYTDIIGLGNVTISNGEYYTGYETSIADESVLVSANISIISYSYEELTVVHSYMYGTCNLSNGDYLFKYFTKFNISTSEEYQRKILIDYN